MLFAIWGHPDWPTMFTLSCFEDHTCLPAEEAKFDGVSTYIPNMICKGELLGLWITHSFIYYFFTPFSSIKYVMNLCHIPVT